MIEIEVLDVNQHRQTGRIEVHVRATLENGGHVTHGPEKTYSIDPPSLRDLHGGEVTEWLAWVKREHQAYAGLHDDISAQLHALKGKKL